MSAAGPLPRHAHRSPQGEGKRRGAPAGHTRGFTLVEVLVALAAMALLAVMAWRGIDAMGTAQTTTRARSDDVLALQAGLAQWRADLDAVVLMAPVGGVDFDGRVLRITRHSMAGDPAEPRRRTTPELQSAAYQNVWWHGRPRRGAAPQPVAGVRQRPR